MIHFGSELGTWDSHHMAVRHGVPDSAPTQDSCRELTCNAYNMHSRHSIFPYFSIFSLQFTWSEAIEESEVYPGSLDEQDSHWSGLQGPRGPPGVQGPDSPGRTRVTFRQHLQQHPLRGAASRDLRCIQWKLPTCYICYLS